MSSVVATPNGKLAGVRRRDVHVFRGIPYARPPRRALRWQPPQPPEAWQGERSARRYGPSAPQSPPVMMLVRRLIGAALNAQSQDCLYLNVWTPKADGGRRPVLVWVHGGAFILGSGSPALYDGSRLARAGDVVVVSINYRLGALGFLNLREIFPEQRATNLGLRDQVAALGWVRDNIEAFGGDPENVTIFGESAGGMSVGTLLGVPSARGLFHRAVAQSGAAHNVSSQQRATEVAECFLAELGTRDLSVLERASVSTLMEAQNRTTVRMGIASGVLPWQPSVDGDLLPEQPVGAIDAGRGQRVPLLVGSNRDEWKLFTLGDRPGRRLDDADLRRRVARALGARHREDEALVDRAVRTYRGATGDRSRATGRDVWAAFQSDRIFHYPAHRLAELQSAQVPATYAYLFDFSPPLMRRTLGACHGLEIPFVFGTLREPALLPLFGTSPTAGRLSARVQAAWIAFARRGDPAHEDLPEWPAYDAIHRTTMVLTGSCRADRDPFGASLPFWAALDPLRSLSESSA